MPINKDQFYRIGQIHSALLSYKGFTFNELLERINQNNPADKHIGRRTLFLDLALMKSLGAPLEKKRKEPYRYTHSFSLFEVFNTNEKEVLKEAVELLKRIEKLPINNRLVPSLTPFIVGLEARTGPTRKMVYFDVNEHYQGLAYLEVLFNHVFEEQVIKVSYVSFENEQFVFTFHPYLLKEYSQRWYVYGLEHGSREIRRFPLDRIRKIEKDNEVTFVPNEIWDAELHFSEMVGISRTADQKPEKIKIRSFGITSDYLLTKPLHHSQRLVDEAEGHCEFEYFVIRNYEFESLLRSFGDGVVEV